ncbi:MAG TPA: 2,3,4,5-tetrahydropyridine-2,6-dicarboxylate N-succinyltransferase [Acidimicrobiales bacterium]
MADLRSRVDDLWRMRAELAPDDGDALATVMEAVGMLDTGSLRVAEVDPATGEVVVHEWLRRAILLLFRLRRMETGRAGPLEHHDKIPLKSGFAESGVRVVPGAIARFGAHLEPGVILMPSFVNVGARVGAGSMIDTWATVGSCAQVGADVHVAGGAGIGGVLEPANARPVVIEDGCMIGSRCMVTQGARVGRGSVLGEGTVLNPGIPVIDAATGAELGRGHVPPGCVVVRAERKRTFAGGDYFLPCALVIRHLEPGDRAHLNDILRESGIAVP